MNEYKTKPARLLLARHGQSVWHQANRYAGRSNVELTETGYLEAKALAHRAERERPDLVVCSPLLRSVETAGPAAAACGLELVIDERLREVDFGDWEGKSLREIRAADPVVATRFEENPVENGFPGGESLPRAMQRALDALLELDGRHPGEKKLLVVMHNTLIRLVLCSLLGIPLKDYRRRFPNMVSAAITEVRLSNGKGALYTLNDAEHLRELRGAAQPEERQS